MKRRLRSGVDFYLFAGLISIFLVAGVTSAQIPGPNVNMVSGTQWPGGDPFLQRQNEPSMAVSTRNPLHLLAGANDYRTVDLPGGPEPPLHMAGDAWLGVFKSFDGGRTWRSTLIPGYPQDTSPEGLASPLKGFDAASDPVVRAGTNGLLYYTGIAFDRGDKQPGVLFLARFIDNNNKESGDPIAYLNTVVVDDGTAGRFLDKPWLAVDRPRPGALMCTIGTQSFLAGHVYVAYAVFVGNDNNIRTKIHLARSRDCGQTWTRQKLSEGFPINQGTTIAIDPASGAVYVFWRQFLDPDHPTMTPNGIVMAKSVDGGQTFTKPALILTINPFDQGTSFVSFRTNSFPTAAVDDSGRVYLAWSQRGVGPLGDARIVVATSGDGGSTWSAPLPVDNPTARSHQIIPLVTFAEGRLMAFYYNLAEDHTVGAFTPAGGGLYAESRLPAGDLAPPPGEPDKVFTNFVADVAPPGFNPLKRRHTLEVFVAEGSPGLPPAFAPSVRVSQYLFGSLPEPRFAPIEQLQFNPPNLPLFATGTAAFIGDYIDITAPAYSPVPGTTEWTSNTSSSSTPVFHAVWTDNRDVRPPPDGNWANYVPVGSTGGPSLFDPSQTVAACTTTDDGRRTGMRNQNIYTSRITEGLFVAVPGNAKPLGFTTLTLSDNTMVTVLLQRAFVVFVQNATDQPRSYRLHIANQPAGGQASFFQFSFLDTLDVSIPRRSSISRTVFVSSTDPDAFVSVNVTEITAPGGAEVPGGLQDSVILNPDISNPDISNPDISNPDISNPDISNAEVYNPDISNPDISNPDISNPDISNPDISNPDISNVEVVNPDISNPDISNPDISNPDISNPDISNPDISNPDISNGSVTDTLWTATNNGNTTAAYTVKLLANSPIPAGFETQLVIHRFYATPVAVGCDLSVQTQNVVIANIVNPVFLDPASPDISNPDISNPDISNATFFLAPGDTAQITLRVVDPNRFDDVTFDAASAVTPAVVAQAVNTLAAVDPAIPDEPPVATALTITTTSLPNGTVGLAYSATLQATGGVGARTWTVSFGSLPPGLILNSSTGEISGSPTAAGTFPFTAQVQDSGMPQHTDTQSLSITVLGPSTFTVTNTNDSGAGSLRQALLAANAHAGADTIVFAIPGAAPHVITPASQLPGIDNTVLIDAAPSGDCTGVAPTIEIDGVSAGLAHGLFVNSTGTVIRGLAITRFTSPEFAGIFIAGGFSNVVECNYLGLAPDGVSAKGNFDGIRIGGSFNNTIGGTSAAVRNIISGNLRNGVLIMGPSSGVPGSAMQTLVQGNFIGTDATGALNKGNGSNGVHIINSASNTIGGSAAARNVIAANSGEGVRIDGATATGNLVQGNYIGTTASGSVDLGNNASGVYIRRAPGNSVIGNVVSGNNGFAGIAICGNATFCGGGDAGTQGNNASGNVLKGNLIGTNAAGTGALGNGQRGVSIDGAPNTVVGGPTAGDGNVIAANFLLGVEIFSSGADGNLIRGNSIGTDAGGTLNLGNGGAGVLIQAGSNSVISGKDEDRTAPNLIRFNAGAGIAVTGGSGHRLRVNQFESNGGLGIDLGAAGVTPNDAGDADAGPNGLQNAPVLSAATVNAGVVTVQGSLNSTSNTSFTIDLYMSGACDASGSGEGRQWFGAFVQSTNATGDLSFNVSFAVSADKIVTALATVGDFVTAFTGEGSTSEFSNCVTTSSPVPRE